VLPHHKYWWVFQALLDQEYDLLVSNEILIEYLEKCVAKYGLDVSTEKLDFLLDLPNVELVTPSYHWQLIYPDPDDDKFVDCAVAGNADFIVTNDKHFNVLKEIIFPRIEILKLEKFEELLTYRRKSGQ
jgi:putative PIN family toxin of toxin-antitoxin system